MELDAPQLVHQAARKVASRAMQQQSEKALDSICSWVWQLDEDWSAALFSWCRSSRWASVVCDLLSFSGDESLLFILPVVLASFIGIYLGGPHQVRCLGNLTCELEALLDLFGANCVCASVEQVIKLVFQRARPSCRDNSSTYSCVWGEWYSFPSGHTLRSFYAATWFSKSVHAGMVLNLPSSLQSLLLCWAALVGFSRVAKGRHYPSDVFVGALVGMALGHLVEVELSDSDRTLFKTFSGISVAVQVWFLLLGPILGDTVVEVSKSQPLAKTIRSLACIAFFGFYTSALYSLFLWYSVSDCSVGRFSHRFVDNEWQCDNSLQLFE